MITQSNPLIKNILGAIILTISILVYSLSHAQGELAFRIYPAPDQTTSLNQSFFEYEQQAGSFINDALIISNLTTEPISIQLYPAVAQVGGNGGLTFTDASVPAQNGAEWIELSQTEITLASETSIQIPFTVRVPSTLESGEYVAGIVAEQRDEEGAQSQASGIGAKFVPRMATAVTISIPGERRSQLEIQSMAGKIEAGYQKITAQLTNTGNIGLKPDGKITLVDSNGDVAVQWPVRLGYFMANGELNYQAIIPQEVPAGQYTAQIAFDYENGSVSQSAEITLGDAPVVLDQQTYYWWGLGVAFGIVLLSSAIAILLWHVRGRPKILRSLRTV